MGHFEPILDENGNKQYRPAMRLEAGVMIPHLDENGNQKMELIVDYNKWIPKNKLYWGPSPEEKAILENAMKSNPFDGFNPVGKSGWDLALSIMGLAFIAMVIVSGIIG